MTQEQVNAVTAKAKTDAAFRKSLRENPAQTLAGYDLTAQERADLQARNLGAEPQDAARSAATRGRAPGSKGPTARESFEKKATLDKATGKWHDNETGKEVAPPPDPDAPPGGTLGGRTNPT